ncbi:unnamed protein product, partial [marine sediment metagenome]
FIEAFPWLKILRPKGPGDVTIEFIDPSGIPTAQPPSSETWQLEIDTAWSKKATKPRQSIPGPTAAMDASRVLGFPKLSASPYKTLQKLLESSELLNRKWSRAGNTIIRK